MASRRSFSIDIGSGGVAWLPSNEPTSGSFGSCPVRMLSDDGVLVVMVGGGEGVWSASARLRNQTWRACS